MAAIAAVAGIIGSVVSAVGAIAAGNAQARAAQAQANALEYDAKIQEQKANQERAVGQRKANEHRHETMLAESKLQTNAAASGASATDPTVIALGAGGVGGGRGIAGTGEYYALTEMATGETSARFREDQAAIDRYGAANQRDQASAAQSGGFFKAAGSILGGASSAFGKFGGGTTLPSADSLTPSANATFGAFPSNDQYMYRMYNYG
jgi:hypothetical protein